MTDYGMAAFSVFFMQCPSWLSHQQQLATGHGRSNCETLFNMESIPCASQVRAMLDPVEPTHFFPVFADVLMEMERCGGLESFRRPGNHVLIALDGTEYHCSDKVKCPRCSTRKKGKDKNGNDKTEYYHSMVSASLVVPGEARVLPLEPEFIAPQDGHDKQDCESVAIRRWLKAHHSKYAYLNPIYLADDIASRQPICQVVRNVEGHFIFVCKPSSHKTIEEYLSGIDLPEHKMQVKRGKQRFTHRYRWMCDVPIRDAKDAMLVNWFEFEIVNAAGNVTYRNSWITDLPVNSDTVAELASCGRARWKIENETFNVLKTKGYNLEHNFGHGNLNLSYVLVVLNLLAFAFHTVCEFADEAWRQALQYAGARARFFGRMRDITAFLIFPSWEHLLATLAFARPPPAPT